MTCIVGLVHTNGSVYMGADSAGVARNAYDLVIRADKKLFHNSEFTIGFTSSFRLGDLLRYTFKPPKIPNDIDLREYMVTKFIDKVRKVFTKKGYSQKENDQELGGCFLVAVRGRLFEVGADYQVGESIYGYNAIGCGESYALGSLYSTKEQYQYDPQQRVLKALAASAEFSAGVRPPFNTLVNINTDNISE